MFLLKVAVVTVYLLYVGQILVIAGAEPDTNPAWILPAVTGVFIFGPPVVLAAVGWLWRRLRSLG